MIDEGGEPRDYMTIDDIDIKILGEDDDIIDMRDWACRFNQPERYPVKTPAQRLREKLDRRARELVGMTGENYD